MLVSSASVAIKIDTWIGRSNLVIGEKHSEQTIKKLIKKVYLLLTNSSLKGHHRIWCIC